MLSADVAGAVAGAVACGAVCGVVCGEACGEACGVVCGVVCGVTAGASGWGLTSFTGAAGAVCCAFSVCARLLALYKLAAMPVQNKTPATSAFAPMRRGLIKLEWADFK